MRKFMGMSKLPITGYRRKCTVIQDFPDNVVGGAKTINFDGSKHVKHWCKTGKIIKTKIK